MSRWGLNPNIFRDHGDPVGAPSATKKSWGPHLPIWLRVLPFCLSAFFFMSALFSILAPLPLLFYSMHTNRKWAGLAILTNSVLVGVTGGLMSLGFYFLFVAVLSWSYAAILKKTKSLEKSAIGSLIVMALSGALLLVAYGAVMHVNPITEFQNQLSGTVEFLGKSVSMPAAELDDAKKNLAVEFPSALAIFALILIWMNTVFLVWFQPTATRKVFGLDGTSLKKWKAPEFLVWPTIITGFFLLSDFGLASDIAINVFKFLMAIYVLHGLSILSHFFDLWKVRGFFRIAAFGLSLSLMMPLVLSLGFFDLWFDFRSKFRQS